MSNKKKDDRIKSGQSTSPHGRKTKEGTSAGIGSDSKQVKINVWPEWSDNDVNNEKWENVVKSKEKDKASKSPQQNLFEDPDGCLLMPPSISVAVWKRCNEVFTKNPVVVDPENGIHNFDIFTPNDHLFESETMRWIICQINTLWMTSERHTQTPGSESPPVDPSYIAHDGSYHSWRFWDHIFSINKVGKGLPQYNPSGKYIVKLFWMGEWRKIFVDDTLPFDHNDKLLLPVTKLGNEIWPVLLSKALLKVASLSYCKSLGEMEFGDFSVIHCLTGWIPQKKIVTKEYQTQIWSELTSVLTQWKYPETTRYIEKEDTNATPEMMVPEGSPEKSENKENMAKVKKDSKDKNKEKKEKEKSAKTHASVENVVNEQDTLVMAAYKSHYSKLNCLTASKIADHSNSLRKMGIAQFYSHPVLLTTYRDCPLIKPITPEPVPAWKLIRPMVRPDIPRADDCSTHYTKCQPNNSDELRTTPIQSLQIQTPFLNYNINNDNLPRSYSNMGKSQVTDIDEDMNDETEPPKFATDIPIDHLTLKETESTKLSPSANRKEKRSNSSVKQSVIDSMPDEEMAPEITVPVVDDKLKQQKKEQMTKWIDLEEFCDCFQIIYIYHRPDAYTYTEKLTDKQTSLDQKEPFYLFTDNVEPTEIFVCVSSFCKWLTPTVDPATQTTLATGETNPMTSITPSTMAGLTKETPVVNEPNDDDIDNLYQCAPQSCVFIAEYFSWKSLRVGQCFKRMQTNAAKAISLSFPKGGRHCLRIFIQSPNGFHCRLISKQQFSVGNEDKIMNLCTSELQRVKDLGSRIVGIYRSLLDNFLELDKRQGYEKQLTDCILGRTEHEDRLVSVPQLTQIFNKALIKTIEKINPDLLTKEIMFPLRCLMLDFDRTSINIVNASAKPAVSSNRNSARDKQAAAAKADNRKQSSTKGGAPAGSGESKVEDKKNEYEIREYSADDLVSIIRLQKCIRGGLVRKLLRIILKPQPTDSSPIHAHLIAEYQKLCNALATNDPNFNVGVTLLTNLYDFCPVLEKLHNLQRDRTNHISLMDFGNKVSQPSLGSGLTLLFRDTFHIQTLYSIKDPLIIKLNASPAPRCSLVVIDNDTGELHEDKMLKRLVFSNLKPNENGYTIMGLIRDTEGPINWKLKLICDGRDALPKFNKPDLSSEFSVNKIKDYAFVEKNGLVFQQMMKVKSLHTVSMLIRLSNPQVRMLVTINLNNNEMFSVEGQGEVFIPLFNLTNEISSGTPDESQDESNRSPSRLSSKSKKAKSAKNSRADSFSSNDESTAIKYSIQTFIDPEKWPMSEEDTQFLKNQKINRKNDAGDIKSWNESSSKGGQTADSNKKDAAPKALAKGKGKDKAQESAKNLKSGDKGSTKGGDTASRPTSSSFEEVRPNWKLYVFSDSALEDNIKIFRNNEKHEQLLKIKKAWKDVDPLRFEKGKQAQMQFLEEKGDEIETSSGGVDEKRPTSAAKRKVKPIDLSEFYPPSDMVRENYDRVEHIEWYREKKKEWDEWCVQEKLARKKRIVDNLQSYRDLQASVDMNRLKFYRAREVIRRQKMSQSITN